MSKHTRGPWKLVKNVTTGQFVPEYKVRTEDDGMICEVGPNAQTANGHLIAAAPELLIACEGALVALTLGSHVDQTQAIEYLKEVIAKAEGKI